MYFIIDNGVMKFVSLKMNKKQTVKAVNCLYPMSWNNIHDIQVPPSGMWTCSQYNCSTKSQHIVYIPTAVGLS